MGAFCTATVTMTVSNEKATPHTPFGHLPLKGKANFSQYASLLLSFKESSRSPLSPKPHCSFAAEFFAELYRRPYSIILCQYRFENPRKDSVFPHRGKAEIKRAFREADENKKRLGNASLRLFHRGKPDGRRGDRHSVFLLRDSAADRSELFCNRGKPGRNFLHPIAKYFRFFHFYSLFPLPLSHTERISRFTMQ